MTGSGHLGNIRRRGFKTTHYLINLSFNLPLRKVMGDVVMQIQALETIESLCLAAYYLDIQSVRVDDHDVVFKVTEGQVELCFKTPMVAGSTAALYLKYEAVPRAGMYFEAKRDEPETLYICTLGEGGLHPNWLPMCTDLDLKYPTEMRITLPNHLAGVSNGRLMARIQGERESTWHWRQEKPHSQYLITVNIGDFEYDALAPALGRIPVNLWSPKGTMATAKYAFRNTTRMIDFFSNLFNYPYAWEKYDHVVQPNFPTYGGMEHTSVTAFSLYVMRGPEDALDGEGPLFDRFHSIWILEVGIAHELLHQWFGNVVTCRSLDHIWLNEGFATYVMYLWNEHELGRDQFLYDIEYVRQNYFEYVAHHPARPLEFSEYQTPGEAFETFHTYYKAALTIHMLRTLMGDASFFKGIHHYLNLREFQPVTGYDLQLALEETSGLDLSWFFKQWVHGAGHPKLSVAYVYRAERQLIDLSIAQIQAQVGKVGLFKLPIKVVIADGDCTWTELIWLEKESEHFLLPCPKKPLMVSLDPDGDLIAEFLFPKQAEELEYQLEHGSLLDRTRALRQLAEDFPHHEQTAHAFMTLFDTEQRWTLRAELAAQAWRLPQPEAQALLEKALKDEAYRVRKAAVLALARMKTRLAAHLLFEIVRTETHENVVGTAIFALALARVKLSKSFLEEQLGRASWFDTVRIATIRAIHHLKEAGQVPLIARYCGLEHSYWVRESALLAWEACAPDDPELHRILIEAADTVPPMQGVALEILERIAPPACRDMVARLANRLGNPNMAALAKAVLTCLDRLEKRE